MADRITIVVRIPALTTYQGNLLNTHLVLDVLQVSEGCVLEGDGADKDNKQAEAAGHRKVVVAKVSVWACHDLEEKKYSRKERHKRHLHDFSFLHNLYKRSNNEFRLLINPSDWRSLSSIAVIDLLCITTAGNCL